MGIFTGFDTPVGKEIQFSQKKIKATGVSFLLFINNFFLELFYITQKKKIVFSSVVTHRCVKDGNLKKMGDK